MLQRIAHESVALSFWSPPYFVGKSYERDLSFEEWQSLLRDVIHLHFAIVRAGGFLAINIADILAFPDPEMPRIQADNVPNKRVKITREQVLEAQEAHPDFSRYQLADLLGCSEQTIDRRLNGNNVRGGKYAVQRKVKLVGGLVEEWASEAGFFLYDWKPGITTIDRSRLDKEEWSGWGSRAVWQIPSVRANINHEAQFPIELPRRVIRLLTAPDDLVLDCFVGSGTTVAAALLEGQRYLGIDSEPRYVKMTRERLMQSSLPMT